MPTATTIPAAAAQSSAAQQDLAQQLATRLGLDRLAPAQLDQLVDEVADSLRETAARLIEILRARSSIKNELRLDRTMLGASENNPLKFSVRGEDALAYMFEDRGGAFLRAEAAIRDSFDDLADHQVAVLAGMRAAYQSMLTEFEPAKLEQRFGPGGASLIPSSRKARLWEAYQEYYARLSADAENAYSRLFGEIFARAYEAQINELKAARRFGIPQ
jgi:type VI secretion system FHA domain protein